MKTEARSQEKGAGEAAQAPCLTARAADPRPHRPENRGKPRSAFLLRLASLLRYPDPPLRRAADDSDDIAAFFDEIDRVVPEGMEELYTRTFDLNPVATLELGWHLWGEQYERGRFLADLRGIQEPIGVDSDAELPDHLCVVLPTIARMSDPDALITRIEPALDKILAPLEAQGNPYRHLIAAVRRALLEGGQA